MRLLGIDYGKKRVGVALSDETGAVAFPHRVLRAGKELLPALQKIIADEGVSAVVIGESHDYHGAENLIMKAITVFKETLEQETGIPVFFEPEFLTSFQAARVQGEHDMLDASAAAIILQSYLDRLSNKNQPMS